MQSKSTEALEHPGTAGRKGRAPKYLVPILLTTFGTKKSIYVRSGTSMKKAISNDGIESTPRYNGFLSDEKYEKYRQLHIPSSKYPKIAKKSDRLFLLVKHTVPTLTDEDKVTICVGKKNTGMFSTGGKKESASTPRSNRGVRCFGDPRIGCALRV
jgi:hypothetical protein